MLELENLTEYRRRLRVLVEDLTLSGITKEMDEILSTWKKGLTPLFKEWLFLMERAFPEPGTAVELVYRLERFVAKKGGGVEIDDMVFIVSEKSRRPIPPDFRIWEPIGDGKIYAHDIRNDHLRVRDSDPYSDDRMMDYILSCQFPRDVLLNRPPVIPEEEPPHLHRTNSHDDMVNRFSQPVELQSRLPEVRNYEAPMTDREMDEAYVPIKQEPPEDLWYGQQVVDTMNFAQQIFGQQYGTWIGPQPGLDQGGWLNWEDEMRFHNENVVPIAKGVRIGTSNADAATGHDSDSDSNSVDVYPELDPNDKGKRPLYPDP